jgi:deoxycytidine triphosphate deaminase
VADRLTKGVATREVVELGGVRSAVTRPDIVNGVWVARCEDAQTPLDRLGQKSLENVDLVAHWLAAGGTLPQSPSDLAPVETGKRDQMSVLSVKDIWQRLQMEDDSRRLVVAPLLHAPKDSGIDLRLGTRFILFRRSGIATFDPLDLQNDPRSIQMYIELSRTERFVLHPQEVVLGATLEYLVMPNDVTGQVITRSSYGRLGLLSATAVQVHPQFHGCLTLELANLSTIPITLTPGERIAQLVMWQTGTADAPQTKYRYPIGPEFSRVRDDSEATILRKLRQ